MKATEAQIQEAGALYVSGVYLTLSEAGASVGLARSSINQRFHKAGIPIRSLLSHGQRRTESARKAQQVANRALRKGKLVKSETCEDCGIKPDPFKGGKGRPGTGAMSAIQMHHDDYWKPLEVRWLCSGCHNRWHLFNVPLNNV